ncbi:MAG: tetratricopeptide repeat protein [Thermoanaerobaculia bacterium]|nr:tetratricopeptide repeat protein [Thermoanaerobaculia bacterium]
MKKLTIAAVALAVLALGLPSAALAGWDEGVAAFKKGDMATAIVEFKAITEAQPDWPGGHYMLGASYLRQDKSQEAIAHLRKAYEIDSSNLAYQVTLGEAYVKAGRYRDAVGFLGQIDASKLPDQQKIRLAELQAVALTKTGQDAEALNAWAQAARLKPDDASAHFQYGTAAYNAGDTQTAIRALGRAASLDPRNPDMQSALVKALNRAGRETPGRDAKLQAYGKAADAAGKLVALNASYDNLMLLGEAQLGAKKYGDAVSSFEKSAAKNTSDWLPNFYQGQAYTALKQYASAEEALRQALEKTNEASNKVRVWKQLGFVYEKQKKYEDAIAAYQRAGDSGAVQRVEENKQTAEYNKEVEAEAERLQALAEEEERLREELKKIGGGGGG